MTENGCDVCEMIDGGDGRLPSLKTTKSRFLTRSLYPNLNLILKRSPNPSPSPSSRRPAAGP